MAALSVRVLGELTVDGIDLSQLDRKARTLLQLLALARGRPVGADALADALWGDHPPARPADQVAVLASRLRRVLGRDRVVRTDAGYRLQADRLDLDELESVVAEAEQRHAAGETARAAAAARVALGLNRGTAPTVPTDADWAVADAAAADRLVRRGRRIAASALLAAGDWLDALDLATADLKTDPLDEEAARTVISAQVAGGRTGLALATYAALRETLADQLGADPAPETQRLHEAVLRGRTAAPQPTASGPRLVGRASQLAHLDSLVQRTRLTGGPRAALVTGDAGIGKTTVLAAWSSARREAGDPVLSGTCGPLDRAAPLDVVLSAIGGHLRGRPDAETLLGTDAGVIEPLLAVAPGPGRPARSVDPSLGPATLYAAVTGVLGRIAADGCAVLVVDDAHLAGSSLAEWLDYLLRRPVPVLVVLGARPAEGPVFPVTDTVGLGPLDRSQVAELYGDRRADELLGRSGGHPLFLAELAAAPTGGLPESLVSAITGRCDQLGAAGDVVRTAAVLGGEPDVELLAEVLGRPTLGVLADLELAARQGLLVDDAGHLRFRHDLVREALVSGTSAPRSALLHREAGRALARRPDSDQAAVAEHARRGGDLTLAAAALRAAARRAAERYDHATAETLLDQSLDLSPDDATRLARARVRIRRGRFREAESDVLAATGAGPERWETAAWAAYFDRRFDDAIRYAADGTIAAEEPSSRTRCLVAAGRVLHARGDLAAAEMRLEEALVAAAGPERLEAAAWLGVVRAHRGRPAEALELLRPATRPGVSVDHTSATLHALLFTGHALAATGRPADALACFARYTDEVSRRDVPRFSGRGVNFGGWVLRNVGATEAGLAAHQEAREAAARDAIPEVAVGVDQDLAEERLRAGDPDAAAALLDRARAALGGDLVFGWRLAMRLQLLDAQVLLLTGDAERAYATSEELVVAAATVGVPRYEACARLVGAWAGAALGEPVDPERIAATLAEVERTVAVEAWWWAGRTGAELGETRWLGRAEQLAASLAGASGPHGDALRSYADRRLAEWRAAPALSPRR